MALPNGLPQVSDLGALLGGLSYDLTDIPKIAVPYTTITNRAQIFDLSKDLGVRMGVNRIQTQQIYQIQDEFGPNGEPVWGVPNDTYGQIRLVGNWVNNTSLIASGVLVQSGSNTTDYLEITFYGTGLNILNHLSGSGYDLKASVDGGAEGANLLTATYSSVLGGRFYTTNQVTSITSGLVLGIHTVKIRQNSSGSFGLQGFEILNESSSIKVNPGTIWKNGQKLYNPTQQTFAYNTNFESGTLGSRGGRVSVYVKPDGSVAKSVTPVNNAQANLTSADHTNEEIARTYYPREFGSGRSDDFSRTGISAQAMAFTLDDGTTSLIASSGSSFNATSGLLDSLRFGVVSDFITLTFIGTGLDIVRQDDSAGSDTYSVFVDGTSIGNMGNPGSTVARVEKIVSGLPYGTHTVKIVRNTVAAYRMQIARFIVYGPKKPTVPSGAVELADYNVMADFVASANATANIPAQGTLRKFGIRENVYVGTWSSPSLDVANFDSGFNLNTTSTGAIKQYTFFGTGYEDSSQINAANTVSWTHVVTNSAGGTVNLSGVGITTSLIGASGGLTFNAASGLISGIAGGTGKLKVRVSGLPLGFYTLTVTRNASVVALYGEALDIITPIHSHKNNGPFVQQNTLSVGSQGVEDNRKTIPVNELVSTSKMRAIALPITNTPTTTSGNNVPIPDMSVIVKSSGSWFFASFIGSYSCSSQGSDTYAHIFVNGKAQGSALRVDAPSINGLYGIFVHELFYLPAGTHIINVMWRTGLGTLSAQNSIHRLEVQEL